MAISDLPGYVLGYKFEDSAAYYDSANKFFIDQAGYSALSSSRLEITTGTPSFVDVNSARGMVLDNTVQGYFNLPIKWGGSMITVWGAPGRMGTNGFILPIICGAGSVVTQNGIPYLNRITGVNYRHTLLLNGIAAAYDQQADDGIYATCMACDQENRYLETMGSDGVVFTGTTEPDNNIGLTFNGTVEDGDFGRRDRFGNLSGTKGDASATSNTMIICEVHFFNGVLTAGDTSAVETELLALETTYG